MIQQHINDIFKMLLSIFFSENGEEENCLELWNRDGKGLKWNDSPCSYGL